MTVIDQAQLETLIAAGLVKAANVLGSSFELFRPVGAAGPLTGAPVTSLMAAFDPTVELSVRSPNFQRSNQALLIGDPTIVEAGDYLVGTQTWFVSHVEALRPAICILCNRTLSVSIPAAASAVGANSYGGSTTATNTVVASGWPASVLTKTHIEIDPTKLPTDTKTSFFEILLPAIPGVVLEFGLILQDDLGQIYIVAAAELSIGGWRLLAGIETT